MIANVSVKNIVIETTPVLVTGPLLWVRERWPVTANGGRVLAYRLLAPRTSRLNAARRAEVN